MIVFQFLSILNRVGDAALPSESTMRSLGIFEGNGPWSPRPRSSAQDCMYNYMALVEESGTVGQMKEFI